MKNVYFISANKEYSRLIIRSDAESIERIKQSFSMLELRRVSFWRYWLYSIFHV